MRFPRKVTFPVVGVTFCDGYPQNLQALNDTYQAMQGDEFPAAVLIRNPDNVHDECAIEVHVPSGGGFIGHIASAYAQWFALSLDQLAEGDGDLEYQGHISNVRISPDHPDRPGIDITCTLTETQQQETQQ